MEQDKQDPIWDAAWRWVRREYNQEDFGLAEQAELRAWLGSGPTHRTAYDNAAKLWLLVGLVPPAVDEGSAAEDGFPPDTE